MNRSKHHPYRGSLWIVLAWAGPAWGSNPTLLTITPLFADNTGSARINAVTGTDFQAGPDVRLRRPGQADIACTGFAFVDSMRLTGGDCDVTTAMPGAWDVVLTNPDAGTATLPGGFIVTTPYVIQPGPDEGKDTVWGTVYAGSGNPDSSNLYYGGWGDYYYDYFEFNLTGAPAAADVYRAEFHVFVPGFAPADPQMQVYRITEPWTEAGVNRSNNPASVFHVAMPPFRPDWNIVDITSLYRGWKDGTFPNYGIKLAPNFNWQSNGSLAACENEDAEIRPKLVLSIVPQVVCEPPSFTASAGSRTACEGASVMLSVEAAGTPPMAFQWRQGGVSLDGKTEASLFLDQVTLESNGIYDVVASNDCGSVVSDAATFVVWPIGGGDVNGDGVVDGADIGVFVETLLAPEQPVVGLAPCAADMNLDGRLDEADVAMLIARQLGV